MSFYPNQIDHFPAKLNKKTDGSVYVVEEEIAITGGKYEDLLAHDNIVNSTIRVFTGSKLTGKEVINYIISVPGETPWRRHIKIFANATKVYVSYETAGDTVEADDVNVLQASLTATQVEIERYKKANEEAVSALDAMITSRIEQRLAVTEVVATAVANKVLRLNDSGLLPASITGTAAACSGNAATAAKLETPRTINGIAFDGSANITIPITALGLTWDQLKGV